MDRSNNELFYCTSSIIVKITLDSVVAAAEVRGLDSNNKKRNAKNKKKNHVGQNKRSRTVEMFNRIHWRLFSGSNGNHYAVFFTVFFFHILT